MESNESAVIVPIPEAEPAVGKHRASLDRTTAWGIPAHVSVIYPFLPPSRIGPRETSQLREAVRSVPGFEVSFADVCWFDDRVVWLRRDMGTESLRACQGTLVTSRGAYVEGSASSGSSCSAC